MLKRLAHAGLVASARGAGGGYRLVQAPRTISVGRVVRAFESSLGVTECGAGVGVCAQESGCAIRPGWQRINQAVLAALDGMTLAELTRPHSPMPARHGPAVRA